jgi:hypothetical protein
MVKSIFTKTSATCANCHNGTTPGTCSGATCLNQYTDVIKNATSGACTGKKKGECALLRVNANTMPPGPGTNKCGGTPCFSATEKALIQAWINGGFPQN